MMHCEFCCQNHKLQKYSCDKDATVACFCACHNTVKYDFTGINYPYYGATNTHVVLNQD